MARQQFLYVEEVCLTPKGDTGIPSRAGYQRTSHWSWWALKAQSDQKDPIAARTQGHVLFPNAVSARHPINLSRVGFYNGVKNEKKHVASWDYVLYNVPQECRYGREASVWFFTH